MGRVRTPTVLQMEATECGAACLGILLRHFGRYVPLLELRERCGVGRDGSDAASLVRAARSYGLEARGFRMELEALPRRSMPVIVFWEFNHFVVLEGFCGRHVALNDPATGPRTVSLEEFDAGFTGVVLELAPGPGFRRGGRPPGLWPLVARRLAQEPAGVLFVLLAGLLLILPQLAMPVFTQIYIDDVWGSQLQDWLKPMLWAMALTIVGQAAANQLQLLGKRTLARRLERRFALRFEHHVLALPERFFSQRYAGDITRRVELNGVLSRFIAEALLPLASGLVLLVFYLLLTLAYSPRLALVVGLSTAANALVVAVSLRQQRDASLEGQKDEGKAGAVLMAALREIETVKSTAIEADVFQRFAGLRSRVQEQQQRLLLRQSLLGLVPSFLTQLNTLAVLVVGFLLVLQGQLSLGMLLAAQQVTAGLKTEIDRLIAFVQDLPRVETAVLRLEDILEHPIDPLLLPAAAGAHAWPAARQKLSGAIRIEALHFGFSPVRPPLIEDLNLSIAPGQRLALVGGSGSGKSTLARLLAGLLQPDRGAILYDGMPMSAIPRAVAVASIAMVQQEIALYGVSVRDNLTLWNRGLPEERLLAACRDAQLLEVIADLPDGLDTILSEGGRSLSGGQRQRLELARALLQEPSILILDEATSALDAETERRVDEALRRRGCTQIIVAHRLSTIRDADQILVLDHGRVVQQGRHRELIAEGGIYGRLLADGDL
ncbi:MAG: NHLP family bacteriocin export ABC transporter peptidase/permease/ATPase subunit [Cyanobacteriota bacterium]